MSTSPNQGTAPTRIELLSIGLKRSLILNLRPISGGAELTASLWVSGRALARSSGYIAADKGLRVRQVPEELQEDFGELLLTVGRTEFALQVSEISRLHAFLAENGVVIEP